MRFRNRSGGVRTSRIAATHGAKVAVVECAPLGGTCVNVGCVPKKLMTYGAHFTGDVEGAHAFGWNVQEPTLDWKRFIDNKNNEILRLNGIYENILTKAGVTILRGKARFVDAHTVEVTDSDGVSKNYTAKIINIAVGGWPFVPEIPGKELGITSNEAFYLPERPKKVLIVGGGYIATEFAGEESKTLSITLLAADGFGFWSFSCRFHGNCTLVTTPSPKPSTFNPKP